MGEKYTLGRKTVKDRFKIIEHRNKIEIKDTRSEESIFLNHNDLHSREFTRQICIFLNDQNRSIMELFKDSEYWSNKALERINELEKENKKLEHKIESRALLLKDFSDANQRLKSENDEWRKILQEVIVQIDKNKDYCEIRIDVPCNKYDLFHDVLTDDETAKEDLEIEHINRIYNNEGFKGLMEYAKTQLQQYGTVKEVEDGLWLLATGGWSDNEQWLRLLREWDFLNGKGHYCAITRGGGYYYSEESYGSVSMKLKKELQ